MTASSLLREAIDPAQIPRGTARTPAGAASRAPRVLMLAAEPDFAEDEQRLSEADAVVIRIEGEAALRRACAAVCRQARRGQTIVLAAAAHLGATRRLLIEPLSELGFEVGTEICVACSPEPCAEGRRLLGAAGELCAVRGRLAIASFAPDVELVDSVEAAELARVLRDLG